MQRTHHGFTLIELMIVVAVIGILASIAIPSYQRYVTESRRAEAQAALSEWALRVERLRANETTYNPAGANPPANTAHYQYTSAAVTASTYRLVATAAGGQATRDAGCTPLGLNQAGDRLVNGAADANNCWRR